MSGGFFRGTTADQDTRFSNKQAKLMKSQKFCPALEHLVDMTKVKMDVLRPWIAKRVTELLGFEDEVLINFIYGLLDAKNVNGKEIQIAITGFMEKNTGKFMKELWTLLLSAQKNASGVPQQFLDEKEEETKKKMADAERITSEILRKKEREAEESIFVQKKMEGGPDASRITSADNDRQVAKHRIGREQSYSPDDRKEIVGRNGRGRKARRSVSSHSSERSPSPRRLRSMSRSPKARKRSISSEREHRNRKRSITPHRTAPSRRSPSLSRRRSSYRRRSRSRSYSHSFSPQSYRSFRHASTYGRRRRSPSPVRRRSPRRRYRRSPSLERRSRSPVTRGSRQLARRQPDSPVPDRSPLLAPRRGRHGSTSSPSQGASPSPRPTSQSPRGRRSPSPPITKKLSSPRRDMSLSPPVHRRRNQQPPSTPRRRHPYPESHKPLASDDWKEHSLSKGRPLSPDHSVSESLIRSASPNREKSPDQKRKLISPSSTEKHSLGWKPRREGAVGRGKREDESYKPTKEASLKATSLEKSLLSSESPANTNGNLEDETQLRNNSRRKESKVSIESPPQATEELDSAQGDSGIRDRIARRGKSAKGDDLEKGYLFSEQNKMEIDGHRLKQENASQKVMGKGADGGSSDSGHADDKKRKHKGSSSRHEVTSDDYSSDSDENAKRRRRKEEKRLRREKRHERHEEKRRKREERRSEKHKSGNDEKKIHDKFSDDEKLEEGDEEEKKRKLEIELRKKALESLKAKKGVGH